VCSPGRGGVWDPERGVRVSRCASIERDGRPGADTMGDSDDDAPEAEQFAWENGAFLIQLVCLASALVMGLVMKHHKIHWLPEAGATLLLGITVGLLMWASNATTQITKYVDFNEEIFFFLLLPPIIFESGFSLETSSFFRNFDGICALAFVGTAISTVCVGVFVWLCGVIGLITSLSITHCLIFGALVSATDPVTVLAVFQELGVNPDLFALVFGESVLNDAVAIVLYRTLLDFLKKGASVASLFGAIGFFLFVFLGSTLVGGFFAIICASFFRAMKGPLLERNAHVEASLVMVAPYCAYAAAEFLDLSGIVAILFCGAAMAHYVKPNLTAATRRDSQVIFKTLATLAETFVFLYMGVGLFLENTSWGVAVPFAFFALIGCLMGRAANIYPVTSAVNKYTRRRHQKIPPNHQNALFVSGLRGAVAFALASASVNDLGDDVGNILRTSTLMIVIFTVLIIGGATHTLVDFLKLREASQWFTIGDEETDGRVVVDGDVGEGGSGSGGKCSPGTSRAYVDPNGATAAAPEFRVENFESGIQRLGAHLGEVRRQENLSLSGKMRAAGQAVGAVANVTSFEDIDKRYIKPYLAPDTPAKPMGGEEDGGGEATGDAVSVTIAPPPASPSPIAASLSMENTQPVDDDGEMTPVKFVT